ncbi:AAA family ATPase [Bacillus thuringiensis]
MVPVICVNNNKGGSLKTTTTVNLAGVLAEKKKKVLIIDCDNQGNIALSFGQNPDKYNLTIYDVLVGDCATEEAIVKVHKYIDIIPSNDNLVGFEFEVIRNRDKYINPFYS